MWNPRVNEEKLVAVAIDKDKRSQFALKWALDHVLTRGQTVRLIHVHQPPQSSIDPIPPQGNNNDGTTRQEPYNLTTDVFLSFRCFCLRREVLWEAVTLEGQDIARALIDYVSLNRVDTLVLGSPSRNGIARLFKTDIPSTVLKGAPYVCSVYVISKGKIASMRAASHPLPSITTTERTRSVPPHRNLNDETDFIGRSTETRLQDEFSIPETDISHVCSGRLSTDSAFFAFYDDLGCDLINRPSPRNLSPSVGSRNFDPLGSGSKFTDLEYSPDELSVSPCDEETRGTSCLPQTNEEVEEKMRRLELQMKQTMDMYHAACREALTAKQQAKELQLLKMEDEKRLEEAERAKEDAMVIAEEEREKSKAALKVAEAAYRKAEKEAEKRVNAEAKALKEAEDKKMMMLDSLGQSHIVLKYQSLVHIVVVLFVFYFYFLELR